MRVKRTIGAVLGVVTIIAAAIAPASAGGAGKVKAKSDNVAHVANFN